MIKRFVSVIFSLIVLIAYIQPQKSLIFVQRDNGCIEVYGTIAERHRLLLEWCNLVYPQWTRDPEARKVYNEMLNNVQKSGSCLYKNDPIVTNKLELVKKKLGY